MKNFLLTIVLTFLVISCSTESDFDHFANTDHKEMALSTNFQMPQYLENPFEARGKKYFDLLAIYLENNKFPQSINEMTHQIEYLLLNYDTVDHRSRSAVSSISKQAALVEEDSEQQLIAILESCSLSIEVKRTLILFFQALLTQQELEYTEQYNYIVSYETEIIGNATLKEEEKETILTVASISRYALYVNSKHRDRDWETSVGNRKAEPAFNSYQAAIISVATLLKNIF